MKEGAKQEKEKRGGRTRLGKGDNPKKWRKREVKWIGYVHREWVEKEIRSRGMGEFEKNIKKKKQIKK